MDGNFFHRCRRVRGQESHDPMMKNSRPHSLTAVDIVTLCG
jgi:hypothetical protein